MSIHLQVDTSEADRELRRIDDGPDPRTALALDAVLAGLFQETQRVVHVITGSLKGSGDPDSTVHRGQWDGQISYGGSAPGRVHDPVRYAELEAARGDLHDFMAPTYDADAGYQQVLLAYLRGEL